MLGHHTSLPFIRSGVVLGVDVLVLDLQCVSRPVTDEHHVLNTSDEPEPDGLINGHSVKACLDVIRTEA